MAVRNGINPDPKAKLGPIVEEMLSFPKALPQDVADAFGEVITPTTLAWLHKLETLRYAIAIAMCMYASTSGI